MNDCLLFWLAEIGNPNFTDYQIHNSILLFFIEYDKIKLCNNKLFKLISAHCYTLKLFKCSTVCSCMKKKSSCGSVVEHFVSSAKVVGSIPREHTY